MINDVFYDFWKIHPSLIKDGIVQLGYRKLLRLSDTYMRLHNRPPFVQIMACRQKGTKPIY